MSAPTTTYSRPAQVKISNRESWLMAAAEHLWGRIIEAGGTRPLKFRVACGWPSSKALQTASSASRTLGQAWASEASEDQAREVFISPALAEECRVMDVLLHEMIHAALPMLDKKGKPIGHGPAFQAIMRAVGLAGKPTATVASEELLVELQVMAHELGRYPHEKLDVAPGVKKPGRMVKGECPDCGNILYGSRQAWEVIPNCGACAIPYIVVPSDEQAAHWGITKAEHAEVLTNVSTTVELKTKDARFTLRSTKTGGRDGSWTVTDHQAAVNGTRLLERDGETIEVSTYDPRWTIRATREDALAFITAIREGDVTWSAVELETEEEELELETEEEELELDEGDLDDLLGPVGEWGQDDDYLPEDEDEDPLYEDGTFDDAEEEAKFEAEATKRDASGTAKSARIIAAGGEGAMD